MKIRILSSCFGVLALLGLAGQANASVLTFNLDQISSNTIGTNGTSLGTVTVTDISGGVTIDVTFNPSTTLFVNTGGPHTPFAFNLNTAITTSQIINITYGGSGVTLTGAGSSGATPYGTFSNGIDGSMQNGGGHGIPGPLDFTITGITTANFATNSLGYTFGADVLGPNGGTGSIASGDPVTAVPEPSTWAMMILGFFGLGFLALRRRDAVVTA